MKKFIKTLLVTMFALPLVACGEEEPVNPPVDWTRYLNPQGGNVEVDNSGEIDFVNKATEALPEGYSIVTLSETEVDEAGIYNVTYAIVDADGNVVYQTTVSYNVTLNYSGIRYDAEYTARDHKTGDVDLNINNSGYLWNAGSKGYLTLDMGGSYSSYVVDFEDLYNTIADLFTCESEEAVPVASRAFVPEALLEIDWASIIDLLEPVISYVMEIYSKYAKDLYVIVDNLVNLTRTITFNTEKCALMFEEIVTPLVEYELITAEQVQEYVDTIKNVDLKVVLSGYERDGQKLSGNPNAIDIIAYYFIESYGFDVRVTLSGDFTYNPDNSENYLSFNGDFELAAVLNKGEESELVAPMLIYKANGAVVSHDDDKTLNINLYQVNPSDETEKTLVGTLEASFVYDPDKDIAFDVNKVEVNYREWDTSYYALLDFSHAYFEYDECHHENGSERCSFYNKLVDTEDTLVGYTFFRADLSFAEPEIALFYKDEKVNLSVYFDLEGASFSYIDLSNLDAYVVEVDFTNKSIDIAVALDYFEVGEEKTPYHGMEFSVKFSLVEIPDAVIASAKDAKGIDYLIDMAKAYLSFLV